MRVTELLRRRLEKQGFKLEKPRSLTEPLITLELNTENRQAIVEFHESARSLLDKAAWVAIKVPEAVETKEAISHLERLLGSDIPSTPNEEKRRTPVPSTIDVEIGVVEKDGKFYYEIDIYQTSGPALPVSEDQLVTQEQLPESCDSVAAVPEHLEAETKYSRNELEKMVEDLLVKVDKLENVEAIVDKLETVLRDRKKELEKLNAKIDKVEGDVKSSLEELGTRIGKLEAKREGRIDEVKNLLNSRISEFEKMINGLGADLRGRMDKLEADMIAIEVRIDEVNSEMKVETDELKADMAKMEGRIKEQEEFLEKLQSD